MEVRYTCPLGSECETAKDNVIYRCRWFVKMRGKDPQTDQEVDEFRCSMEWAPVLMVEHSMYQRQTGAAVESMRNTISGGVGILANEMHKAAILSQGVSSDAENGEQLLDKK